MLLTNVVESSDTSIWPNHTFNRYFKVGLPFSKKKKTIICFNQSFLKMMENAFYFKLKALFVLEIFKKIFVLTFWLCRKTDKTAKVNSKIDDAADWRNNYNTYIVQYLKK